MKIADLPIDEYHECVALSQYLHILQAQGKIRAYSHIPNSTFTTSWNQKRKNKAMGVSRGVPDYLILTDQAIFIEMKRKKGGTVSSEQKEWIKHLEAIGIVVTVCKGFNEAKEFIDANLKGGEMYAK